MEGIVYDKHECQVMGVVNLGGVNNQLLNFERHLQGAADVAKEVLVFMVRGIFTSLTLLNPQLQASVQIYCFHCYGVQYFTWNLPASKCFPSLVTKPLQS